VKRAAALTVGSLLSIALITVVAAAWLATTSPGGTGRAIASILSAGSKPMATATAGSSNVGVSWAATGGSTPVAGYTVKAYDAGTLTPRAIGGGCTGAIPGTSCTDSAPNGTWRYSVTPRNFAWAGAESPLSDPVTVDANAPTATITFPASSTYTSATWNAGCSSQICGTAADVGTGVASVAISIRQGAGNYWNGTAFASASEVLLTATGTTSWTRAFPASNFPADGTYTVRAVATDGVGNTGSASSSFTIDNTGPNVAITMPTSAGSYGTASWNAGCSSQICGTASDASGVASVAISIRQGAGNYWNGTAFASASEVLLTATGTTSWTRAFPASNFPADGTYAVRAVATDGVGNTGTASSSFTIDVTRPTPTALVQSNANGFLTENVDELKITYSEALNTSTFCSAWSGTGDQTLNGSSVVVTVKPDAILLGNSTVSVTAGACTLHIGTMSVNGAYTLLGGTATFSGTGANESRVTWTSSTHVLTIHLGQRSGGISLVGVGAGTATYTPDAAIADPAGNLIITTAFNATGQRF
jgi:hypothetical protein